MAPLIPEKFDLKNELEHEPEPEIVKVKEAKTAVVDEVDAPSDAHAPGTPEKSIKSPPAMYWQRLEERYGKKIVKNLAMTNNEGTPSYISSALF